MSLLHVENLQVDITNVNGSFTAVQEFSVKIEKGEIHGILGESGSGKSLVVKAILGILPRNVKVSADHIMLDGINLLNLAPARRREVVCNKMSIIFQDATDALDPCFTIGYQLFETLRVHEKVDRAKRKLLAKELLYSVGFGEPEPILKLYPHQLSLLMKQRASIAITLASRPKILVADEPTAGLDPASQAQINELLLRLNIENEMAIILISHDFSVLNLRSDTLSVMYCGQIMETGHSYDLLSHPRHPYTRALLDSAPSFGQNVKKRGRLFSLKGLIPSLQYLPVGCPLGPRCPRADRQCVNKPHLVKSDKQPARCHIPIEYEGN